MLALIRKWMFEIIALLLSLIIGLPIYLIVMNSFKNSAEAADLALSLPRKWSIIENYVQVFREGSIPLAFYNSALVTFTSVVIIIFVCSTSAYVLQRRRNGFTRLLEKIILSGLILPISIITTYKMMHALHLTGSYLGIILLYIATAFAFTTFIYINFFDGISKELDEAGVIDGAQGFRLFREIIFPLLKPINASVFIISFVSVWNDFGLALYFLNNSARFTLGLTVFFFFGQRYADWNLVFTDLVLISVPSIVAYLFLQKYIISGLTAGAVKG